MRNLKEENTIAKMKLLCLLLGIGAIVIFLLAGTLNLRIGWAFGLGMFFVAAAVALLIAFLESDEGDNIPILPRK